MTDQRIDWQAIRERLESAARSLDAGVEVSPERARRILEDRAQLLARVPPQAAPDDGLDLLVFTRMGDRYGVEGSRAIQVLPPTHPTPVPGARPSLAGVINHRGEVLPVVELWGLMAAVAGVGAEDDAASRIVVVGTGGMRVGLRADEVQGVVRFAARDVTPRAAGTGLPSWIRGTTAGMVAVVDLEALVRDPRLIVEEAG
jgi:purine-binding chemotaxis protein CheW